MAKNKRMDKPIIKPIKITVKGIINTTFTIGITLLLATTINDREELLLGAAAILLIMVIATGREKEKQKWKKTKKQ